MKNKEYALWLKPAGSEFKSLIEKYSNAYNTPLFDTHITLLSGIRDNKVSIKNKVNQLLKNAQPFSAHINKISHSDFYFRSVILELEPVSQLSKLLKEAKTTFEETDQSPYLAHISIVYSNLSKETRARITREIEYLSGKMVMVESISIIEASTDMSINDWKVIAEYDL